MGHHVKAFSGFERILERKMRMLDSATTLADLGGIPGNRLERLRGDREGQYSLRINDQYRICFEWPNDGVRAVEIEVTDYH